jgi:hypothetical protein
VNGASDFVSIYDLICSFLLGTYLPILCLYRPFNLITYQITQGIHHVMFWIKRGGFSKFYCESAPGMGSHGSAGLVICSESVGYFTESAQLESSEVGQSSPGL